MGFMETEVPLKKPPRAVKLNIILVRHGEAEDSKGPDAHRPLSKSGEHRVRQTARALKRLGVQPDVLLCSPLRRCRMTASILSGVLDIPAQGIKFTRAMAPGSRPSSLKGELEACIDAHTALLVGHAPHLDRLIMEWLGLPRTALQLKKAGAAYVELEGGYGTLRWFASPGLLRKIRG